MSTAVSELEEATRTIHVEGKWISMNTDEKELTIVDAGMPTSGDFIKYFVWCEYHIFLFINLFTNEFSNCKKIIQKK